jgi:hypothetical protein
MKLFSLYKLYITLMGGSKSSSDQTITNKTINKNYLDSLNKTIMNAGVETLVKQANQCSTATNQNNLCKADGIKTAKDFVYESDQANKAKINFSCINSASAQGDMSQEMMAQLLQDLKSTNDTKLATTLNALAENKSKSGFLSTPPIGSVDSNTTQTVNQTIKNKTVNKIQNIYEQNLQNNFTSDTVNECIGKSKQDNTQDVSNVEAGGDAKIKCIQSNDLEAVQNCQQLTTAVSKTSAAVAQELGLTIINESTTKTENEATGTTKTTVEATGPISELGDAFSGILGAFGMAFLAPFVIPSVICSVICCCILIIVLVGGAYLGGADEDGNFNGDTFRNSVSSAYGEAKNMSMAAAI